MASINDFKSQVKDGLARTSHFRAIFTLPPGLNGVKSNYSANLSMFSVLCDNVVLPGLTNSTNQTRVYGEYREVPYERLYAPASLNFYVDGSFFIKTFFDDWMNIIQNEDTRDFKYATDYTLETLPIEVFDTMGKPRYKVVLHRCFPKNIQSITLDYAGKDMMKMSVDMSYQFYRTENISINKAGGLLPSSTQQEVDAQTQDRPNVIAPRYFYNDRPSLNDQLPDQLSVTTGRGDIVRTTTP